MKKILLVLLFCSFSLYASEALLLKARFFKYAPPKLAEKTVLLEKQDIYYQDALDYLNNPKMMLKKTFSVGDPEQPQNLKKTTIKTPNYPKALQSFQKSWDKYKNVLSAYIALNIIETKIPANTIDSFKYKRIYAEALYNNLKSSCVSYINYADVLTKGIATSPNLKKALKVLNEAAACIPTANIWEKEVLQMKKDRLKMLLKDKK